MDRSHLFCKRFPFPFDAGRNFHTRRRRGKQFTPAADEGLLRDAVLDLVALRLSKREMPSLFLRVFPDKEVYTRKLGRMSLGFAD